MLALSSIFLLLVIGFSRGTNYDVIFTDFKPSSSLCHAEQSNTDLKPEGSRSRRQANESSIANDSSIVNAVENNITATKTTVPPPTTTNLKFETPTTLKPITTRAQVTTKVPVANGSTATASKIAQTPAPINKNSTLPPTTNATTLAPATEFTPYHCTLNGSSPEIDTVACGKIKLWEYICRNNCNNCDSYGGTCLPFENKSSVEWKCVRYEDMQPITKEDTLCMKSNLTAKCDAPEIPILELVLSNVETKSLNVTLRKSEPKDIASSYWKVDSMSYCIELADISQQKNLNPEYARLLTEPNLECSNTSGFFDPLQPAVCYIVSLDVIFVSTISFKQAYRQAYRLICTKPTAPSVVPSPSIEATAMTITLNKAQKTLGQSMCYYVLLISMTATETLADLEIKYIDQTLNEFLISESMKDALKLRPYLLMAIDGDKFNGDKVTYSFNTGKEEPELSSCGPCKDAMNAQLSPGNYLALVVAAVNQPSAKNKACSYNETLARKSDYLPLSYVLPKESGGSMWIPITILTTILILSLIILSLLFITRNRRCEGMQIFSKLRFGEDVNDSAFIENNPYNNQLMGQNNGSVSSRNNLNVAMVPINSNGFHGLSNSNIPQVAQMNNYAQVDPQKRMQADNDFKVALIEEYGPEYLEDRRKCVIQMSNENAKEFVERKCTTPHFYYTFYKSRGLPCPGQPLEPEPKYHEMTQWDFEFERIAHDGYMEGESAPPQVLNDPSVVKINKFSDVCPYEFNRVKLTHGIKNNPNKDKTNGSLIQFPGLHTKFIAIQGPDQSYYINQFWQIVYEYNCDVLIMLASFNVSSGKDGVQYWPDFDDHEGATQVYGNYTVTMTDKRSIYSYMDHRVFQVTFTPVNNNYESSSQSENNTGNEEDEIKRSRNSNNSQSDSSSTSSGAGQDQNMSEPGETKIVHHFHFTMWNDYGIPTDTSSFWSFMDTAMAYHESVHAPVLVHCRAGIGRTGTFIAAHYLREMLERDHKVDVHRFVWQLRAQRKKFVQKVCQYRFIHQALLEHILFAPCRMQLKTLQNNQFSQSIKTTVLRQLQNVEFVEKYREHHLEKEKGDYNGREETFPRDFQKVPYKYNFVRFPADIIHEVYSSYLNASWICGYNDELKKFIVTDLPYEVKHKTFWWMVLQHKVSYIVYIGDLPTDGQKKEKPYWPEVQGQSLKFGRINVTLLSKKGFMPNEHGDDFSTEGEDDESNIYMNSSSNGLESECKSDGKCSSRSSGPYSAIVRQLVLTVSDDDENLARGEEWHITHVQYLLLEGATGPPSSPAHFAHFVSLVRNNLVGDVPDTSIPKFNHKGVCNCTLKRGMRDSAFNRSSTNSAGPNGDGTDAHNTCDCAKPLVVQCLTGGLRSALFCAIWMLAQDLEQTRSCNVPFLIHRLLEQRCTIFPCRSSDIALVYGNDCFKFVYDCLRAIASGSLDNYSIISPSDSSGIFSSPLSNNPSLPRTKKQQVSPLNNGSGQSSSPFEGSRGSTRRDSGQFSNVNGGDSDRGQGSLRPHHPSSPRAQQDAISFTKNLESPLQEKPGPDSSSSNDAQMAFSTFKRNKMSSDYANVDSQLESSIV
ncbi:uncharacterized protein LOC134851006 isoform X3 [Symsagittifera roscoffensis]|uniref:uncharacterized protein LOC134851006 isoform X3 n=1 Tax=Symsagittifera roscoffensis TaxID=84072 RepID=UPI00307C4EAD